MTATTASDVTRAPVGFAFFPDGVASSLDRIARADRAGVGTVWAVMPPMGFDTPTMLAAALATTERVTVGTAIVPAFVRHPLTLAAQARVLEGIAPGRLRLGIGTGNLGVTAAAFDVAVDRPLRRLREYLEVLRAALHEGAVRSAGEFYGADVTLGPDAATGTPVLAAALGPAAFGLAGELTDGALAWACPVGYLLDVAAPALAKGAARAGRPTPPLLAQVPVVLDADRERAIARAHGDLDSFTTVPVYASMFAEAGFPPAAGGGMTDALVDELLVSGTPDEVAARLGDLAAGGLDELMVTHIAGPDPTGEEATLLDVLASLA